MNKAYYVNDLEEKFLKLMFDKLNYEYKECLETYYRFLDYYSDRLIKDYGKDNPKSYKILEAKEFIKDALDDIYIVCRNVEEYL